MQGHEAAAVAVSCRYPRKFMQNNKIQMKHHGEKQIDANITRDVATS